MGVALSNIPRLLESQVMRFLMLFSKPVLLAVVLWIFGYLYGLYCVATGGVGITPLLILAATSIGLVILSRHFGAVPLCSVLNLESSASGWDSSLAQ